MLIRSHLLPRLPRVLPRTLTTHPLLASAMSTSTPPKYDWLCIMPDKVDALERRLKVRPLHFENLKPLVESKFINFGGAYLDTPPEDGKPLTFRGSVLTCVAESKEAVIEILKQDPYTVGDVWDWEKVQIFPMKVALRTALEN